MSLHPDPDLALLRQYAEAGSQAAFAELVRRHIDFVYAAALRQLNGDVHLARDVAQIVFTDLARKASKLTTHRMLAGWLHTSSRYAAAKLVRTERRRQARHQEAQVMKELTRDDSAPINWSQLQPLIDDALGRLRPAEREAILLHYFEGHTYAEIGGRLGRTESATRSVVDRAVDKLGRILARRGIASTATAVAAALAGQGAVAAPADVADSITAHALAGVGASGTTSGIAALLMSITKLQLGISVAIAGSILVACLFVGQRRASPAPTPALSRRDADPEQAQRHNQTAPTRSPSVAFHAAAEPGRNNSSARDTEAARAQALDIVSTIYGPLLDRLKVSPGTRERFLDLVCDERQAAYDVVSVAGANRLSYLANAAVERMALDAATSTDAKIRALLTPDEFNEFIDYRNMRGVQVSVTRVAERISESGGTRLTEAQAQGLIKIFLDTQTPGQLRRAPVNAVLALGGVGITDAIINSARTLLSDQQQAALVAIKAAQSVPERDKVGAPPSLVRVP